MVKPVRPNWRGCRLRWPAGGVDDAISTSEIRTWVRPEWCTQPSHGSPVDARCSLCERGTSGDKHFDLIGRAGLWSRGGRFVRRQAPRAGAPKPRAELRTLPSGAQRRRRRGGHRLQPQDQYARAVDRHFQGRLAHTPKHVGDSARPGSYADATSIPPQHACITTALGTGICRAPVSRAPAGSGLRHCWRAEGLQRMGM